MTNTMDSLVASAKRKFAMSQHMIDRRLTSANFPNAPIRDGLVLLHQVEHLGLVADGWRHTNEILERMKELGYSPGTALEMAHFACNGWNLESRVAALGTIWVDEAWREASETHADVVEYHFCATLGCSLGPDRRSFLLNFSNTFWQEDVLFLAVKTP